MKKALVVILIFIGFIVGVWLARENRKLFELPIPVEERQGDEQRGRISVGMEIWQVKQALGVPEKRVVVMATQDTKKEEWVYGSKCLYFTNGVLMSWQEGEGSQRISDTEAHPKKSVLGNPK